MVGIRRRIVEAIDPRARATPGEPWRRGRTWLVRLECGHELRIRRDRGPLKTTMCYRCGAEAAREAWLRDGTADAALARATGQEGR